MELPKIVLHLLSDEDSIVETLKNRANRNILFVRPVQSGKTKEALIGLNFVQAQEVESGCAKASVKIMVGDNNLTLNNQTNSRVQGYDWTVLNFTDFANVSAIKDRMRTAAEKKERVVFSFLMQIDNLQALEQIFLSKFGELNQFTMLIDEGDKNRSSDASKEGEVAFDDEEEEVAAIPPVTKLLLGFKNFLSLKDGSRCIYITATPLGILSSERSDWVVLYKEPYKNYVGVGYKHNESNVNVKNIIGESSLAVKHRWTGNYEDRMDNTLRPALMTAVKDFVSLESKDESYKQVMLVSLENRKKQQGLMSEEVKSWLDRLGASDKVAVIVLNGDTKKREDTLQSLVTGSKASKVIVIAGFMAARGVSFTEHHLKYELVAQVHYTKKMQPMNSSLQAMRIFGPARRTISRPILYTNRYGYQDISQNFVEYYRIFAELASGNFKPSIGKYNWQRPYSQLYNFRFMKRGMNPYAPALFPSSDLKDWEPLMMEEEED